MATGGKFAHTMTVDRRTRLPDDFDLRGFPSDQYFDLRGLAAYASLSVSSLRAHIRSNHLPAYQVHGKILVRKREFDKWLSQFRVNRAQDLNRIADEIIDEIGFNNRRSHDLTQ